MIPHAAGRIKRCARDFTNTEHGACASDTERTRIAQERRETDLCGSTAELDGARCQTALALAPTVMRTGT